LTKFLFENDIIFEWIEIKKTHICVYSKPNNSPIWAVINVKNKALVKSLGKRIKELRKEKGLSQEDLSNEAEVPLSQIGRMERGEINPTISTLFVISKALEIDLKHLVDVKVK
jgi:ribosome-binding protein aMBF1 (putative translation factor)